MVDIHLRTGADLRVDVVGPAAFRVRSSQDGTFAESALARYGVVRWPDAVPAPSVLESADRVTVRAEAATLAVSVADGSVELARLDGTVLATSAAGLSCAPDGTRVEFALRGDERLYGLGDVSRDRIQRRGQRIDTWVRNVASYVPIPFVMSSRGWGLFANSTRRQIFDLGQTDADVLSVSNRAPAIDVVLFGGDGVADVLSAYTGIVGRPMLLPQWAYGLTFVCHMEADARTMLDDASRMREHDIPCDVIGLEPGWMEKWYDYSTDKRWHPDRFHIPEWMLGTPQWYGDGKANTFFGALERLGFKLSLWLCSDYDISYEAERRAVGRAAPDAEASAAAADEDDFEQDEKLRWPVYQDLITKPEEPWFEHLKKFVDQGASAFKLDGANQIREHPDRAWGNGMSDAEMHNLYPVLLNQQLQEGFAEHTGRRLLLYSAGGYAGIAQYAATWAGDTGGGPKPLVSMLNHGLSGHSNTSCDMLVFSADGIHFGFLQPWSQVCSWAYWRHPWLLGETLEPIFRHYAKLRYRLLPYIYSMAYAATQTGMPILRAMPLAYPDDLAGDDLVNQYMLGDFLLVGAFSNDIHLPAGEWIDFWTGARHAGPADLTLDVPDDRGGPLLVKAGAILPTWPEMSHVGHRSVEEIGLEVYPGSESGVSSGITLYEDDGDTVEHVDGAHATTDITCVTDGDRITIAIAPRSGRYAGMPERRRYAVTVHSPRPYAASSVNGENYEPTINDSGTLGILVSEDSARRQPITITLDLS